MIHGLPLISLARHWKQVDPQIIGSGDELLTASPARLDTNLSKG